MRKIKTLRLPNETTISCILGSLVIIIVGILVFNYFESVEKEVKQNGRQQQCICN